VKVKVTALKFADVRRTELMRLALAAGFLAVAVGIVIACLADYHLNSMHTEIFWGEVEYIKANGHLQWSDFFTRFFDCKTSADECGRGRYLSFLVFYLNKPFRLWLAQFIPPHPSLSLNWLFDFASVYFLYAAIRELTEDRAAALITAGLYILSAGFLSLVLFLFNPAKPEAAFFINVCLYMAAKITKSPSNSPVNIQSFVLYISLFLGYCSDETTYILPALLIVLFPEFLQRQRRSTADAMISTFPLYLAFATFVAPIATDKLWGYGPYSFWEYVLNVGPHRLPANDGHRFSLHAIWQVVHSDAVSQYAWWWSGSTIANASLLGLIICIVAAAVLADSENRRLIFRTAAVVVCFAIFQGVVMLRHYSALGTYYYSAAFSNFSLVLVGASLSAVRKRLFPSLIAIGLCCYLGYAAFTWMMNAPSLLTDDNLFLEPIKKSGMPELAPLLTTANIGKPLSYRRAREYWSKALAGQDVSRLAASLAPRDAWLPLETQYVLDRPTSLLRFLKRLAD